MTPHFKTFSLMLGVLFALSYFGELRAEKPTTAAPDTINDEATKKKPTFRPPFRGTPSQRVGAGSRGLKIEKAPRFLSIAPKAIGRTTSPQPKLYWYLSEPWLGPIQWTLQEAESREIVMTQTIPFKKVGLRKIDLQERQISLEPDLVYEWKVAFLVENSKEVFQRVGGLIQYVVPTEKLNTELSNFSSPSYHFYVQNDFWQDAMDHLIHALRQDPTNRSLKKDWISLMRQAELPAFLLTENDLEF